MEDWDKIDAVQRMQNYIEAHWDEDITMELLSAAAGYSRWHALRVFKELTGKTPLEFARAVRLTKSAAKLRDTTEKVSDVALDVGYDSHDGFTRAFSRQFAITPQKYREETPPIPYFTYTPVGFYHDMIKRRSDYHMDTPKVSGTVTVTMVQRPARKLVLLRSTTATEYFSFCEEVGCDWHGMLDSIPEKLETSALLTLPKALVKPNTSATAGGVEVPADYVKPIPDGYEIIDLPPCAMLVFQGMPFENEADFGDAIGIVFEAIDHYKPEVYGYRFDENAAPRFNLGATAETGARMMVPVKAIGKG